jgi:hypothetical protein
VNVNEWQEENKETHALPLNQQAAWTAGTVLPPGSQPSHGEEGFWGPRAGEQTYLR